MPCIHLCTTSYSNNNFKYVLYIASLNNNKLDRTLLYLSFSGHILVHWYINITATINNNKYVIIPTLDWTLTYPQIRHSAVPLIPPSTASIILLIYVSVDWSSYPTLHKKLTGLPISCLSWVLIDSLIFHNT